MRGRWTSSQTARIYIEESVADLVSAAVPADVVEKARHFAGLLQSALVKSETAFRRV